jgi:hypothetical protein
MSLTPRIVAGTAIAAALTMTTVGAIAAEPTKEQCISSNEEAQTLRANKKLRAARAELLRCVSPSCPRAVHDDCAERLDDLERATPTIVFSARAGATDLRDVKVTMDGAPLADTLDGSPLLIDPGEHAFSFAAPGHAPITKTFVIAEGAKNRNELIDFTSEGGAAANRGGEPSKGTTEPPADPSAGDADPGSGRRVLALGLGGAGIVGIGLGAFFALKSKSTYDDATSHCPNGPTSCTQDGVTGGEDARGEATIATIGFIAGAALLTAGVVVFLTAPKKGSVAVQPMAGPSIAGIRLGGAW